MMIEFNLKYSKIIKVKKEMLKTLQGGES